MKNFQNMTEPELRHFCNAAGRAVVDTAASHDIEKPMFVLVLFNDPVLGQYVSNCCREDVIKAMRETADRLEREEDVRR